MSEGGTFEPVSCETFGLNESAMAAADCGYVTVPENRAAGTDATIQLGVVRLPSTSDDPGAPLFIGTGGPGGDGLFDVTLKGADEAFRVGSIIQATGWRPAKSCSLIAARSRARISA